MKSLAKKIALQFFLIIALIGLVVTISIFEVMRFHFKKQSDGEIMHALDSIEYTLRTDNFFYEAELTFPSYITYTIYNKYTNDVFYTNDPFIPILSPSEDKVIIHKEKDFYTDGDLVLLYSTRELKNFALPFVIQASLPMDILAENDKLRPAMFKALAVTFLPLLCLSYLVSYGIAKKTLRPIKRMTATAANISSSNLDASLEVTSQSDELDALASTFNDLFARIKQDFVAVNAANEAKSIFLSNMSHEIRTPINAVLGLDEMILRESRERRIKTYARDIQSSGRSLLSIINDILDFSKIEAGKMEIIPVDYDMVQTIADLINMIQTRADDRGLEFIVDIDKALPRFLHGDESRIKQCILNILTNAVKYTPQGSVTLNISSTKISEEQIALTVHVKDTGIGIKKEDMQKLFSPFERIEERRNRSIEGTGLGVSIVQNLLEAMSSKLEVNSVYGEGSDFYFTITQEVRDWIAIGNYEEARKKEEKIDEIYTESFQAPEAHILVVDDTPMNLTVIKGLLKYTRIQIDTAQSGLEALEMAKKKRYDILLIDHLMPKMDGIETLHRLRTDSSGKSSASVCIALTANAISGAKEMYLEAGFKDYLSKPVESAELEKMLASYLPSNLVLRKRDEGFIERSTEDIASIEDSSKKLLQISSIIKDTFNIDIIEALKNCGDQKVFLDAIECFYCAIEDNAKSISEYEAACDLENYRIQVHSLKSSSRLIGATELSKMAERLEKCIDDLEKEPSKNTKDSCIATIKKETPVLLDMYKSYLLPLKALYSLQKKAEPQKPLMQKDDIENAIKAIKEAICAFDFDTAQAILCEVDSYDVSSDFKEQFKAIKEAVQKADYTASLKALAV